MNQGSRLTVMAHFDFFAAMAMGPPPIAISGLKNKCAIPECPQLACDPSGGVRRTPFYTYRCTFWDSDPAGQHQPASPSAGTLCGCVSNPPRAEHRSRLSGRRPLTERPSTRISHGRGVPASGSAGPGRWPARRVPPIVPCREKEVSNFLPASNHMITIRLNIHNMITIGFSVRLL